MHPARLAACGGEHVPERRPGSERAVADHEPGLVEAARLQIAHHAGPGLGALAVAVLDREQLLGATIFEHVNAFGTYTFDTDRPAGQLRPLRAA
jgi:hypothetical protein